MRLVRAVNLEKARRLQFLVGNRLPDAADYGWLIEFNTNDCEAKADCDVLFLVPLVKGTISGAPNPEYSRMNNGHAGNNDYFLFADNPGAISRGVADRDAKCDHFCW